MPDSDLWVAGGGIWPRCCRIQELRPEQWLCQEQPSVSGLLCTTLSSSSSAPLFSAPETIILIHLYRQAHFLFKFFISYLFRQVHDIKCWLSLDVNAHACIYLQIYFFLLSLQRLNGLICNLFQLILSPRQRTLTLSVTRTKRISAEIKLERK